VSRTRSQRVSIVSGNPARLFIDFDGLQVEVVTEVAAARDLFERTYRSMLVPDLTARAGLIEVHETPRGYSVNGLETLDFKQRRFEALVDYIKLDVVRQFVKARPDLLWMHGAAVEREGSALLIVGRSGQGKSTLSTRLCEAGWRFLSDDVAPIRMDADEVIPFPQSAFRRVYPGHEIGADETGFLSKEEVPLPDSALHLNPAPIRAVVFPSFKHGASSGMEQLSPGNAAIEFMANCFNFDDHQATAVARIARLAELIPMYRLTYGDGSDGADAIQNGLK
jgi:hypothetical protein